MIYALAVIAIVMATLAIWLLVRGPGIAPNSNDAKRAIQNASDAAQVQAHHNADVIRNASDDDIAKRVNELRAKGRQ